MREHYVTFYSPGTFVTEETTRPIDSWDTATVGRSDEKILASNMECNGWPVVAENTNSWKATLPFGEEDVIVDDAGNVVERGDDPKWVKYRAAKAEERRRELDQFLATKR
jgi:hypothetical protein